MNIFYRIWQALLCYFIFKLSLFLEYIKFIYFNLSISEFAYKSLCHEVFSIKKENEYIFLDLLFSDISLCLYYLICSISLQNFSINSNYVLVKTVPPDPTCSSTLESIRQNPKFARLLGFSVNNLSELLRTINPKHRVNAYFIMEGTLWIISFV